MNVGSSRTHQLVAQLEVLRHVLQPLQPPRTQVPAVAAMVPHQPPSNPSTQLGGAVGQMVGQTVDPLQLARRSAGLPKFRHAGWPAAGRVGCSVGKSIRHPTAVDCPTYAGNIATAHDAGQGGSVPGGRAAPTSCATPLSSSRSGGAGAVLRAADSAAKGRMKAAWSTLDRGCRHGRTIWPKRSRQNGARRRVCADVEPGFARQHDVAFTSARHPAHRDAALLPLPEAGDVRAGSSGPPS